MQTDNVPHNVSKNYHYGGYFMECPIKCGMCCYDADNPEYEDEPVCHYWSKDGCRLPRDERPDFCNVYLCKRAEDFMKQKQIEINYSKD